MLIFAFIFRIVCLVAICQPLVKLLLTYLLTYLGAFKFYSIVEKPNMQKPRKFFDFGVQNGEFYAAFSEPFCKIAYAAAILTAKINLEFGATCHIGSAPVLKLN